MTNGACVCRVRAKHVWPEDDGQSGCVRGQETNGDRRTERVKHMGFVVHGSIVYVSSGDLLLCPSSLSISCHAHVQSFLVQQCSVVASCSYSLVSCWLNKGVFSLPFHSSLPHGM